MAEKTKKASLYDTPRNSASEPEPKNFGERAEHPKSHEEKGKSGPNRPKVAKTPDKGEEKAEIEKTSEAEKPAGGNEAAPASASAAHEELHHAHESQRRDLHGSHRDAHRKMTERHKKERDAATSHEERVKTNRRHEHERHAMHGEHIMAHHAMGHRHHAEHVALNAQQEAEMAGGGMAEPAMAPPAAPEAAAPAPAPMGA